MILQLFPEDKKSKDEEIARFHISYQANCRFEFNDIDGASFTKLKLQNFVNSALERSLMYLKLNYLDIECFDKIYFKISDENNQCCKATEDMNELSVEFKLCYDSLIEMNKEEKIMYYGEGDYWMAKNKMEHTNYFIAEAYKPKNFKNYKNIESVFKSLGITPNYVVDNFEFFSVIGIKDGYNYFDVF